MKTCPIDSKRATKVYEGEKKNHESYSFPLRCREGFVGVMKKAGYVENPDFAGKVTETGGYSCLNCKYFSEKQNSVTGYWCKEWGFPDRPEGCCSAWEEKPILKKKRILYQMPNGKWYWNCPAKFSPTADPDFMCNSKSMKGFTSKIEAADDLAQHINFRHVGQFKFDKAQDAGQKVDLGDAIKEYGDSRNAIRHALLAGTISEV